jgi:hypothetical protein
VSVERRRRERRVAGRRAQDRRVAGYFSPEARRARRRRRLVILGAVLGLLLIYPVAQAVRHALTGRSTVPAELIGLWVTAAPEYADRGLEFTPTSVLLHTDETHFTVHPVHRVTRSVQGLFVTYHVEYEQADGVTGMDFRLVPGEHPLIQLSHQPYVWRRTTRR